MDEWNHEWKVSVALGGDELNSVTSRISEYYHAESTKTKTPAFSRHHALILAALGSSSKLVSQAFPATIVSGYERPLLTLPTQLQQMFTTALTSTYQKGHLTALAGMTGLLVTRLLMLTPQIISLKTKKKHAEITQQYIHSALAAEYLLGNRYYRHRRASVTTTTTTTTTLEKEKHPVGFMDCDFKSKRRCRRQDHIRRGGITPVIQCQYRKVVVNDSAIQARVCVSQRDSRRPRIREDDVGFLENGQTAYEYEG